MSDWNEELAKAKAERRSPAPNEPRPGLIKDRSRKTKVKPKWGVFYNPRHLSSLNLGKSPWFKAATREECEDWIEKRVRSTYVPKNSDRSLQDEIENNRSRYSIKELE